MKNFVFRNSTLEPFFPRGETEFSGYGDVSRIPSDAENFLWFYTFPPEASSAEAFALAESFFAKLKLALAGVPAEARFFVVLLNPPPAKLRVVASDENFEKAAEYFNSSVREQARARKNMRCVTVPAEISDDVDWRFFFSAQVPFSPKHLPEIAEIFRGFFGEKAAENAGKSDGVPARENVSRQPSAENLPVPALRKKCLVLDLDETLWGGVVGEDGVGGIEVGGSYPGNAFSFFQKKISELADSGIILAIASKNNAADVEEVFEKRAEMPLSLEKFSARKIDWRDKATQVREIAEELNIGLDAIVFADNSPAERAWINAALPDVATPAFPSHLFALPDFFVRLLDEYFRAETLTREDLSKTEQYRANRARERFARECASLEDYLAALQIELSVSCNDVTAFPRLAQLSQKTNQFNLANRRFSLADLEKTVSAGTRIYALSVKDIFGDNGICGVAVVDDSARGNAEIAEFALSCRVLGRGIENEFLAEILRRERSRGVVEIYARFVPSQKNLPAKNFYARNGFAEIAPNVFSLKLSDGVPAAPGSLFKINLP